MGRGLDVFYISSTVSSLRGAGGCVGLRAVFKPYRGGTRSLTISVAIARGIHLFPFRTEPLSLSAPMVLGPQGPGRVGRRRSYVG